MEPTKKPFGDTIGRIDGGRVCGLEHVLGNDVDGAFGSRVEIAQCVFSGGERPRHTNDKERRIMAYDVGVGEGGQIRGCTF